jgi:hypothetical protein
MGNWAGTIPAADVDDIAQTTAGVRVGTANH